MKSLRIGCQLYLYTIIEFDDKYTNAKNKLLDFIKTLDELDDIQKAKLAQEFITSYSMANSFEQFVSYMKNGGIK